MTDAKTEGQDGGSVSASCFQVGHHSSKLIESIPFYKFYSKVLVKALYSGKSTAESKMDIVDQNRLGMMATALDKYLINYKAHPFNSNVDHILISLVFR